MSTLFGQKCFGCTWLWLLSLVGFQPFRLKFNYNNQRPQNGPLAFITSRSNTRQIDGRGNQVRIPDNGRTHTTPVHSYPFFPLHMHITQKRVANPPLILTVDTAVKLLLAAVGTDDIFARLCAADINFLYAIIRLNRFTIVANIPGRPNSSFLI